MGRGGTARPPKAEWSSGVADFLGGGYNQDIFKDPKKRHDHLSVLYNKDKDFVITCKGPCGRTSIRGRSSCSPRFSTLIPITRIQDRLSYHSRPLRTHDLMWGSQPDVAHRREHISIRGKHTAVSYTPSYPRYEAHNVRAHSCSSMPRNYWYTWYLSGHGNGRSCIIRSAVNWCI